MTWLHRPGRQWHYALPGANRFVCGSFFLGVQWDESNTVPDRGHSICIRCERLLSHAFAGALPYKGQSHRKVRGKIMGAHR